MEEQKLMKLSNLAAINKMLSQGWRYGFNVIGSGKEATVLLTRYTQLMQLNSLGNVGLEIPQPERPVFSGTLSGARLPE